MRPELTWKAMIGQIKCWEGRGLYYGEYHYALL